MYANFYKGVCGVFVISYCTNVNVTFYVYVMACMLHRSVFRVCVVKFNIPRYILSFFVCCSLSFALEILLSKGKAKQKGVRLSCFCVKLVFMLKIEYLS